MMKRSAFSKFLITSAVGARLMAGTLLFGTAQMSPQFKNISGHVQSNLSNPKAALAEGHPHPLAELKEQLRVLEQRFASEHLARTEQAQKYEESQERIRVLEEELEALKNSHSLNPKERNPLVDWGEADEQENEDLETDNVQLKKKRLDRLSFLESPKSLDPSSILPSSDLVGRRNGKSQRQASAQRLAEKVAPSVLTPTEEAVAWDSAELAPHFEPEDDSNLEEDSALPAPLELSFKDVPSARQESSNPTVPETSDGSPKKKRKFYGFFSTSHSQPSTQGDSILGDFRSSRDLASNSGRLASRQFSPSSPKAKTFEEERNEGMPAPKSSLPVARFINDEKNFETREALHPQKLWQDSDLGVRKRNRSTTLPLSPLRNSFFITEDALIEEEAGNSHSPLTQDDDSLDTKSDATGGELQQTLLLTTSPTSTLDVLLSQKGNDSPSSEHEETPFSLEGIDNSSVPDTNPTQSTILGVMLTTTQKEGHEEEQHSISEGNSPVNSGYNGQSITEQRGEDDSQQISSFSETLTATLNGNTPSHENTSQRPFLEQISPSSIPQLPSTPQNSQVQSHVGDLSSSNELELMESSSVTSKNSSSVHQSPKTSPRVATTSLPPLLPPNSEGGEWETARGPAFSPKKKIVAHKTPPKTSCSGNRFALLSLDEESGVTTSTSIQEETGASVSTTQQKQSKPSQNQKKKKKKKKKQSWDEELNEFRALHSEKKNLADPNEKKNGSARPSDTTAVRRGVKAKIKLLRKQRQKGGNKPLPEMKIEELQRLIRQRDAREQHKAEGPHMAVLSQEEDIGISEEHVESPMNDSSDEEVPVEEESAPHRIVMPGGEVHKFQQQPYTVDLSLLSNGENVESRIDRISEYGSDEEDIPDFLPEDIDLPDAEEFGLRFIAMPNPFSSPSTSCSTGVSFGRSDTFLVNGEELLSGVAFDRELPPSFTSARLSDKFMKGLVSSSKPQREAGKAFYEFCCIPTIPFRVVREILANTESHLRTVLMDSLKRDLHLRLLESRTYSVPTSDFIESSTCPDLIPDTIASSFIGVSASYSLSESDKTKRARFESVLHQERFSKDFSKNPLTWGLWEGGTLTSKLREELITLLCRRPLETSPDNFLSTASDELKRAFQPESLTLAHMRNLKKRLRSQIEVLKEELNLNQVDDSEDLQNNVKQLEEWLQITQEARLVPFLELEAKKIKPGF